MVGFSSRLEGHFIQQRAIINRHGVEAQGLGRNTSGTGLLPGRGEQWDHQQLKARGVVSVHVDLKKAVVAEAAALNPGGPRYLAVRPGSGALPSSGGGGAGSANPRF